MDKPTAVKIDIFLGILVFISFFTTDWDYLNSDEGGAILRIVYIAYAVIIGIGIYVTYLGYAIDTSETKPATMDADQIETQRRNSTLFIVAGIILWATKLAFLEPDEGIGLLLLAAISGVIGLILGFNARSQEARLANLT